MAAKMPSPVQGLVMTPAQTKEAERIYLINCGICHGPALDGNGPITEAGGGGYPAVPPSLKDAKAAAFTDGHIYHVMTFGKGSMGSYASQLTPEQRWWVIKYIRTKQAGVKPAATDSAGKTAAAGAQATTNSTPSK
jgi:mono/diheme cytochrome c family protein